MIFFQEHDLKHRLLILTWNVTVKNNKLREHAYPKETGEETWGFKEGRTGREHESDDYR